MNRWRLLAIVTAVILILDQATKLYVDAHFELYESVPVIPGWFHLTYIRNQGAAFGILSNSSLRIPFFNASGRFPSRHRNPSENANESSSAGHGPLFSMTN